LRESAIIALGIVALVLSMELLTYSPMTPDFPSPANSARYTTVSASSVRARRMCCLLFGRPAFLFPLVLGAACWGLQRRMKAEGASRANTLVRIAGSCWCWWRAAGDDAALAAGALRQTAAACWGSVCG